MQKPHAQLLIDMPHNGAPAVELALSDLRGNATKETPRHDRMLASVAAGDTPLLNESDSHANRRQQQNTAGYPGVAVDKVGNYRMERIGCQDSRAGVPPLRSLDKHSGNMDDNRVSWMENQGMLGLHPQRHLGRASMLAT